MRRRSRRFPTVTVCTNCRYAAAPPHPRAHYRPRGHAALWCPLAIRAGTARSVVLFRQMGMSLQQACEAAMRDLPIDPRFETIGSFMNIVAVDQDGNHCGVSNSTQFSEYCYMTAAMEQAVLTQRLIVAL